MYYKVTVTDSTGTNELQLNAENLTFIRSLKNNDESPKFRFTEQLDNIEAIEGLSELYEKIKDYESNKKSVKIELYNEKRGRAFTIVEFPEVTKVLFSASINLEENSSLEFAFLRVMENNGFK